MVQQSCHQMPRGEQLARLDWHTRVVADNESSKADEKENRSPTEAAEGQGQGFGELQYYVPQDILDVSFPAAVRGYDRHAVDTYIKRVNRVIAELKVRGSPPAAVRHALEQAEDKVRGLLQAAREAAEEITASAQQEAEENTARAKADAAELTVSTSAEVDRMKAEAEQFGANARREADETVAQAKSEADGMLTDARAEAQNILARTQAEADERLKRLQEELSALREEAETRRREIQADTEAVWKERHELLEDIRRMAAGLVDLTNAAAGRVQRGEPAGPQEEMLEFDAGDEIEPGGVAREPRTDESREDVAERTAPGPGT
jgi:DivIVA domain-containing protein